MFTFWFIVGVAICGSLVLESQAHSVQWGPIDLGPMKVSGLMGQLGKKYWPLHPRDHKASCNARVLAEDFHRLIKTGWGVIPPLDPYHADHLRSLKIRDHEVRGTVNLSNFRLVGAKEYKVKKVQVRLASWRLDFVLKVPLLRSKVNYHAKIKVDKVHNHLEGHVNVTLHNVVIKGALTFKSWPKKADLNHQKLSIVGAKYKVASSNVQYNARDLVGPYLRRSQGSSWGVTKEIAQKIAEEQAYTSALGIIQLLDKGLYRYTTAQVEALLTGDCPKRFE